MKQLGLVWKPEDVYASFVPLAINAVVTLLFGFVVFTSGTFVSDIDYFDFGVESLSSGTYFILFWAVYLVRIRAELRHYFAASLLTIQLGRLTDAADEVVIFGFNHASAMGDTLTLVGELILVFAAFRWIMVTSSQANTDPLTGLFNRRYHLSQLERFISRSVETGIPFAVVSMDIDNFKSINDKYGHPFGDTVIQHISTVLRSASRSDDVISRVGGEEFEILIPRCDRDQAQMIAERMRKSIEETPPEGIDSVTGSFGVSVFARGLSSQRLRDLSDEALYKSKKNGKNQVTIIAD